MSSRLVLEMQRANDTSPVLPKMAVTRGCACLQKCCLEHFVQMNPRLKKRTERSEVAWTCSRVTMATGPVFRALKRASKSISAAV